MSMQSFRSRDGGLIDRTRVLSFTFDGTRYTGHPGDTLASALLANGVHLVGRSFKYHRPRGILASGAEEPNALVQLRQGNRSEPNQRATQVELYDGLVAESQNRWPSLNWDIGEVNDLLGRFLPSGFYYKTFMWPASMWHTYEKYIRRAAGLGKAPEGPDPDRYEKVNAHCDVLIVGAGPAGLAAAKLAARTGADVILVDEQMRLGGSLLAGQEEIDGNPAIEWVKSIETDLLARENVRILRRTTVTGYYDHNYLVMLERVHDHVALPPANAPRQRLWKLRAEQVVLATGALERPLVFQDNDRPGVLLARAAREYAVRFGAQSGRKAVIFTNNDSAYDAARDLLQCDVEIAAIIDSRPNVPVQMLNFFAGHNIDILTGRAVSAVIGRKRVEAVEAMHLSEDGKQVSGAPSRIECDLVCMSGGWNPTVHLYSQAGGKLRFDESEGIFLPDQCRQAVRAVGAANGDFSLAACLENGAAVGEEAANDSGHKRRGRAPKAPKTGALMSGGAMRPFWLVPNRSGQYGRGGKHFVDFQNDVTAADIQLAAREGYRSIEHIKRYTTTGMATDQGKTSNVNALAIAASSLGQDVPTTGHTTFRPPYTPLTFGAIAGRDIGNLLDPERKTPMHHWHESNGAVFEPVGQWLRPFYYPRAGEDMHSAVMREAKAARESVGILDATTLGKIDIQGRDAPEFLNRIYTNAWKGLKIGACRYGLMLQEDGMLFDDGVTARLAEDRYHMTTTTGGAARVLGWLENWSQTEWPELEVYFNSCTEQWAVASICGPNARRLLAEVTRDIDLSPEAFPFLTFQDAEVAGIPARIYRISFTGELAFEINVPASYGLALWQALMTAGEKYNITPYGTEAMHVLRAEVGFIIVGQETDGTVTPIDLGMEWAVSRKKDFIGKRSLSRADTGRADRKQLVGLLTDDPNVVVPEGAQLIERQDLTPPVPMVGHITSSYESPTLGRSIALALLTRGGERHGQKVYVAFDGQIVPAKVTQPKFFDLDGERARG
jgi:sarcosine oxidase subunit alpha